MAKRELRSKEIRKILDEKFDEKSLSNIAINYQDEWAPINVFIKIYGKFWKDIIVYYDINGGRPILPKYKGNQYHYWKDYKGNYKYLSWLDHNND